MTHSLFIRRNIWNKIFYFCGLTASLLGLAVLLFFVSAILRSGWHHLNIAFLTHYPSRFPDKAGFLPAIVGSFYLILITVVVAFPLGVATAIYLEEYTQKNRLAWLVEVNINNLAGVPSIIYGILGLQLFVRTLHLGRSLLSGGLIMALLVLPIIILASREALRTVPKTIREAAFALGASRWQVTYTYVLPAALPGILTGTILAVSRAIGETAPLITIGALTYMAFLPDSVFSPFTAMPIQIFNWVSRPQKGFWAVAGAGILVLLFILLIVNSLAVYFRYRTQRKQRG